MVLDGADPMLEEKGWAETGSAQSKIRRRAGACWVGWSCGLGVGTPLAIGEDSRSDEHVQSRYYSGHRTSARHEIMINTLAPIGCRAPIVISCPYSHRMTSTPSHADSKFRERMGYYCKLH